MTRLATKDLMGRLSRFLLPIFLVLHIAHVARAQSNPSDPKAFVLYPNHLKWDVIDLSEAITVVSTDIGASHNEANLSGLELLSQIDRKLSPDSAYWANFVLSSSILQETNWVLQIGRNSFVDVYMDKGMDGLVDLKQTGISQLYSKRDIQEGKRSKIGFEIGPDEKIHFFIKCYSTDGSRPNLTFQLIQQSEWIKQVDEFYWVQGIFNGIIWMFFIYNLLLFLISFDRVYLVYSLYIASLGCYFLYFHGIFTRLFLSESPDTANYVWILSTGLMGVFYFKFVQEFLNTKQALPNWHKILWYYILMRSVVVVLCLGLVHWAYHFPMLNTITQVLGLAEVAFSAVLYVAFLKAKLRLAPYFIIGSASLSISLMLALVFYNVSPSWFANTFQSGVLTELLLFSIGLGYRIRINEEDKLQAQAELIAQLEENESLQQKVNRELENKVRERTADLEQKNQEVIAQSENLAEANAEIIKQHREGQERNKALERAYSQIKKSINYAKRIQEAILGSPDNIILRLSEGTGEAFIFFQPKDVVSGDFYWYTECPSDLGKWQIMVVGDCTGHGIPGAFMTVLGSSLLNEIVNYRKVSDPAVILATLDAMLINAITQVASDQIQINDGMDLSILAINRQTSQALYAGAKSSLILAKKQQTPLRIKGERFPIGGAQHYAERGKQFVNHSFELQQGDLFYLITDGFQDQFGGKNNRKYLQRNLITLLQSIAELPMLLQHKAIQEEFEQWKGDTPQTDDVLIAGVRI